MQFYSAHDKTKYFNFEESFFLVKYNFVIEKLLFYDSVKSP